MVRGKRIRARGKIPLSRQFQDLKEGDLVTVIREISVASSFPKRLQGRTGVILEKRGKAYIVKIKDVKKEKRFIIEPVHLKRIETN